MKAKRWWSVPLLWNDLTVAVMASGEGLTQDVADAVRAANIPAIVTNSSFLLVPWADMLYAADARWWRWASKGEHAPALRAFAGIKVCAEECEVPDVLCLRARGRAGFNDDPGYVVSGGNSGYQAVHVAAHAGAKRILLCGMNMTGEHWHGRHPLELRNHGEDVFPEWRRNFAELAPELSRRGIDVANVTPNSALECFRRAELCDELARVQQERTEVERV